MGLDGHDRLLGNTIWGLLLLKQVPEAQFSSGEKPMKTSNHGDWQTSNTDDTIVNAARIHSVAVSSALYYPSLIGNSWDDELLPSGD